MSECGAQFNPSYTSALVVVEECEQGLEIPAYAAAGPLKSFPIELDEVIYDGTKFLLNNPIILKVYVEDGVWCCENNQLASFSYGSSIERAVHGFCEDFAILWSEIAKAPNDILTNDAKRIKYSLRAVVKEEKRENG